MRTTSLWLTIALSAVLCFLYGAASAAKRAPAHPAIEVRFLPCLTKEHQIEAEWWSCSASPSTPVPVFGRINPHYPTYGSHVYLAMPRIATAPSVKWKDSRGLVTFPNNETFVGPASAVAAPGYQLLLPAFDSHHHQRSGRTELVATLKGSVRTTLHVPAIVYQTVRLGCYVYSEAPGIAFDTTENHAAAKTPPSSDLYVTGKAGAGGNSGPGKDFGCPLAFVEKADSYVLNFPGGGTVLESKNFAHVTTGEWKNDTTKVNLEDVKSNVLIFKTRAGAIVKLEIMENTGASVAGIYEVAGAHGTFPY